MDRYVIVGAEFHFNSLNGNLFRIFSIFLSRLVKINLNITALDGAESTEVAAEITHPNISAC